MKIKIKNGDYLIYKGNILYKDDDFYISDSLIYDETLVIPRKEKQYDSIKELPEYIRDRTLREVI